MSIIDPSIPLMSRSAPMADPMASLGQGLQLKTQMESARALQEQRESLADHSRLRAEAAARELREAEALRNLTDVSPESIYGVVGPEKGAKILKGMEDFRSAQLKTADDVRKSMLTRLSAIKSLPTDELRSEWYSAVVKDYADRGIVDPSKVEPYSMEMLDA